MKLSLRDEEITLSKEVEIIAVIKEHKCIERIVRNLKKSDIESEVFWMKDPLKALDYIEKLQSSANQPFRKYKIILVIDGRFGVDSFEYLKLTIEKSDIAEHTSVYVYPEGISPLEYEIFLYKQARFIDCHDIKGLI